MVEALTDESKVSARIIRALDSQARALLPADEANELLLASCESAGVESKQALDERSFIPVDAFYTIGGHYRRRLGESFIEEAISATAARRVDFSAISLPELRAPGLFYLTLDRARSYYAQHISFEVNLQSAGHAHVRMRYLSDAPRSPETCSVARGVLRAIPMIMNQPAAEVICELCYAKGDPLCSYRVSWHAPFPYALGGLAAGIVAASAAAALSPSYLWLGLPLASWWVGRSISESLLNRYRTWALESQRLALELSERDFSRRFHELERVNSDLERRIQDRTLKLRHALATTRQKNTEMREALDALRDVGSGVIDVGVGAIAGDTLDEFAHEMKNPLGIVISNLDYLEEAALTPPPESEYLELQELQEVVSDVRHGVDQIRGVLSWFLDMFRSDGALTLGPYDLNAGAQNAVEMIRQDCAGTIEIHTEWGALPPVSSCGRQLEQVFLNLLVNAVHAMRSGKVWVSTHVKNGRAVAIVRDTGIGMNAVTLARAFERGYTTKPSGVGSGLGLYICRAIIRRCGGDLTLRSEVGVGTEAELQLPLWPAKRQASAATPPTHA